ncbi:DUF2239 family protein [Bdellovibrio sp. HCB337]|uniref:DUF2239 family protein n=1 Tax=Bdellovibrio sp. HCB337 TaxID=3394358 RepID=UPI0039A62AC4
MDSQNYTAFEGEKLLKQGALDEVVLAVKKRLKSHPDASILVFSDLTGKEMDFDLSGSEKEVLQRLQIYLSPDEKTKATAGPGRPKLGVVAREVSLLPRHWEWLSTQSGGASATLRRLIDDAKKQTSGREILKQAQERTYKFMATMAGNLPHYEEALRALYAKDSKKFKEQIAKWPTDIREHTKKMAEEVFE